MARTKAKQKAAKDAAVEENKVAEAVEKDEKASEEPEAEEAAADAVSEDEDDRATNERIAELEEQLAAAQARADDTLERLQRTTAEFQNSKKRQEKQLQESIERASTHLIKRILPVMDDLDLAFKNIPEDLGEENAAWVSGFEQIQKKLLDMLKDEAVTVVPLEGAFDPSQHEAISSEPSEEVESGHIIETLRLGYEHRGRVLRPALVRVAA